MAAPNRMTLPPSATTSRSAAVNSATSPAPAAAATTTTTISKWKYRPTPGNHHPHQFPIRLWLKMPLGRSTDCPIPNQNASLPAPSDPWQTTTYRGLQQGYRSASSWNHTYMKPHLRRAERAHKTRAKETKETKEESRMVSDTVYWDIVKATLEVTVAISVCAVTTNKLRCNDARQSCTTSQMKARKIVVRTAVTSAANRLDLMATVAIDIPPATATPSSPPVEPLIRHISSTGIRV
ncbi:Uncharacterized protein APZ42_012488 [Daphnia magna]|uniref:Uncharacterized protein n=1 Tax=Daphnia magna TaxID=35525 RepID=A0A0P5D4A1_9CRUS|nr:Uncharacterized protein APZ42_012488 [Daphnia magna]